MDVMDRLLFGKDPGAVYPPRWWQAITTLLRLDI